MAALKNIKHEAFSQGLADGKTNTDAYLSAGYEGNAKAAAVSANRLLKDAKIVSRVNELRSRKLKVVEQIEARSLERTIARGVASRERVLAEWARIAFFDLRHAVQWTGSVVTLTDSTALDDDTALAIAEVRQGKDGVSIKAVDKVAALTALSKHFGIFADDAKAPDSIVNNVTNNLLVLEAMTPVERLRRIATMLRDAGRTIDVAPAARIPSV